MFGQEVDQVIEDRFRSARTLLTLIKSMESDSLPPVNTDEVKILRGLFFVHLYGAFEKSVTDTVQAYLRKLAEIELASCHVGFEMWPSAFDNYFRSLQTVQGKGGWAKRREFAILLQSEDMCPINEGLFSDRLQNVRPDVLIDILGYLGLSVQIVGDDVAFALTEVVEKRNQVAHGRADPKAIGANSTSGQLEARFDSLYELARSLIDSMRLQLAEFSFIKEAYRAKYREKLLAD